jgi:hypothetical protein
MWFDAADSATVLNASDNPATHDVAVKTWKDKSGLARDVIQPTGTSQPLFKTNMLNGMPAIYFDGSNDCLTNALTGFALAGIESYIVGRLRTGAEYNRGMVCMAKGAYNDYSSPNGGGVIVWSSGYIAIGVVPGSGADSGYNGVNTGVNNLTLALNNYYAYSYVSFSLGHRVLVNGSNLGAGTNSAGATVIAPDRIGIGCRMLPNAAGFSPSEVAEILIYTNALNVSDRYTTERYLETKYGLAFTNRPYAGTTSAQGYFTNDIFGIGTDLGVTLSSNALAGLQLVDLAGCPGARSSLFAGHRTPANSLVTTDLPTGVTQRWERVWYLDKKAVAHPRLAFTSTDAGLGALNGSLQYYLLRSVTGSPLAFTVSSAAAVISGNTVSFDVPVGEFASGYYTLGVGLAGAASATHSVTLPVTNNLVLWLDASDATTIYDANGAQPGDSGFNGTGVVWATKGTVAKDAGAPLNSYPRYVTNTLNGKAVFQFNGTSDALANLSNTAMALNGIDSFVVGRLRTMGQNLGIFCMATGAGNDYSTGGVIVWNSGVNTGGDAYYNNVSVGTVTLPVNNFYLNSFFSTASGMSVVTNGVTATSKGSGSTGAINPDRFSVGSRVISGAPGSFSASDVGEVIVYSQPLNSAQRKIVQSHLAAKYDLPLSANQVYTNGTTYRDGVFGIGKESDGSLTNGTVGNGLTIIERNGTLANGKYVMAGQKVASNSLTNANVPSGIAKRWTRVWYVKKTGSVDARLTFDFSAGGIDSTGVSCVLLYSAADPYTFTAVNSGAVVNGSQFSFDLSDASLSDGYYTVDIVQEGTLLFIY